VNANMLFLIAMSAVSVGFAVWFLTLGAWLDALSALFMLAIAIHVGKHGWETRQRMPTAVLIVFGVVLVVRALDLALELGLQ
jgi:hypothetical protein